MRASVPLPFTLTAGDGWRVTGLPAFNDNYLWLMHDTRRAVVVDPGDAAPVLAFLQAEGLRLEAILCTHHHGDHVGGVAQLLAACGALPVYGPVDPRIPHRTHDAREGATITLAAGGFSVMEVPGHTSSHVSYLWQDRIFCGDTLFALGCGRLFEGTPEQMHRSLSRLSSLSGERWVHCAHEYTLSNLAFALQADGSNPILQARALRERARRATGQSTIPARLSEERATNPFLRSDQAALRASAEQWSGQRLADPVAVFAALRSWKDAFRT